MLEVGVLLYVFLPEGNMRISTKGQVTIPHDIRQKLGLLPNTEVEFRVIGDAVQIVKSRHQEKNRGRGLITRMRGKATIRMTTDEIMALTRGEE